ncbi:MAG: YesL family protein [Roseburia sp.]|nr:YesL family protein [Roseburia sp.]
MDRFFNSDNVVMRVLSKIFDIGWLSIIYVLFCIPVVTFGAATTSLYYVSAKVLRHDRSYVWTEFWRSFKQNFLQSTIMWIITIAVYGLLYFNISFVNGSQSGAGGYLVGAYLTLGTIVLCVLSYAFCVLSRFDMKITKIFRFSLYLAFRHFIHTLLLLVILFAAGAGVYVGFVAQVPILLMFVPGLAGFLYTFPMEHLLKKYTPKSEAKYTEDGEEIVEWYNE